MTEFSTKLPYTLLVTLENTVATVTLNRPDKRNALDDTLIAGLTALFSELSERADVRVVVITGAGGHFCSGLYLNYLEKISHFGVTDNLADSGRFRDMMLAIYQCPKPVIAKVEGYALAGGCGIASVCDLVIADSAAQFGYTEVRFGFIPAIVGPFLYRRVGESHARDLLLTARIVTADEAFRMGLVNRVTALGELDGVVAEYCEILLKNSATSLELTKGMVEGMGDGPLSATLDQARNLNALTRTTEDFKKGLAKFLEK